MNERITFNVIEKTKSNNKDDIEKHVQSIVNKLIAKEFVNIVD